MAGRHHVLLIGIDAYDGGGMLTGCANDIDAIQRVLIDRVGIGPDRIARLAAPRSGSPVETDVPASLPTLERIRAEFVRLGSDAVSSGDRVFIYYSGHGTQCIVADAGGQKFSREALLPKDKVRGPDRRFLFDWELNALVAAICARTPSVTFILDSCSSAGATRDAFDEENALDRFFNTPDEVHLEANQTGPGDLVRGMTGAASRVPGCLVVAACRDDERARESPSQDGPAHGELTRALVRQFTARTPAELTDLRWGRIWRAVEADVRTANPRQSPWLSGNFGRRVFGFGGDEDGDPGFAVTVAGSQYRLDVGSLAGVTEDATIAVYGATPPAFPPLGTVADRDARKGLLKVTRADRATCEAVAVTSFELPEAPRGRLVAAGQAARLRVALNPHDDALAALIAGSSLAEVVTGGPADLTLLRRADGAWALTDDVHGTGEVAGEPVLAAVPADALAFATPLVEHYAAYITPLRMARACRDLPSLLRMWLLDCNNAQLDPAQAQSPDLPQIKAGTRAPYELTVGDRLCIVVENAASERLAVTLIDCAASGKVLILGEKQMPAQSRHVFWLNEVLAQAFVAGLAANRDVGVDRLAAIATTRTDVSLRHLAVGTSFDELLERLRERDGTRDLGDGGGEMPAERWTSALTALRITPRRN